MSKKTTTLLQLLAGAVCLSFSPVFVEISDQAPAVIGLVRTGVGGLVLALVFRREILDPTIRPRLGRALPLMALAGAAFAGDLYFWHRAIGLIGGGVATVLANTQVFYVLILGRFLFEERVGALFWICAMAAVLGVALLSVSTTQASYLAQRSTEEVAQGLTFGLLTGLCYAVFLLGMKGIQTRHGLTARTTHALVSLLCAFSLLLIDRVTDPRLGELATASPRDGAALLALALLVHVGGWLLIATALPHLPSGLSSMILLVQPCLATLHGAVFFGQRLSGNQILGTGILLGSVAAANAAGRRGPQDGRSNSSRTGQ